MGIIYHIATQTEWDAATTRGFYAPSSAQEPILCADADHYVEIANLLFAEQTGLVLIFVDTTRLAREVWPAAIEGIPILYLSAPLHLDAIFEVGTLDRDANGRFIAHHETNALSVHGEVTLEEVHRRASHALAAHSCPWWIAGGWAIDTFLGQKTRPHADLEISILSSDQRALYEHLEDWDLRIVAPGGSFARWDGQPLSAPYHQIWARQGTYSALTPDEFSADPTMLDFLIEDHMHGMWRYRRDERIIRSVQEFGDLYNGIPFVRPEVALLFKAKSKRFKDQRDFEHVLPRLDQDARQWLRAGLHTLHPAHAWCNEL